MALSRDIVRNRPGHSVIFGAEKMEADVPKIECRCRNPKCNKLFFIGQPAGQQLVVCPRCHWNNFFGA